MNRFKTPFPVSPVLLRKAFIIGGILMAASVLLSIGVEWISRGSLPETLAWLTHSTHIFALNVLIGASALVLIYSLFGSLFLSIAAAGVLLSVVAFINYYKSKLVGEPFFPWDIILRKEGMDVGPLFTGGSDLLKLLAILAVLGGLVFLHILYRRRLTISWASRFVLGAASAAVLLSFSFQTNWAKHKVAAAGVDETIWNQQVNYDSNGLLLAFTLNVQNASVDEPEAYTEEAVDRIAAEVKQEEAVEAFSPVQADPQTGTVTEAKEPAKQPNVIFIMSEAFWDPTLLPNVAFSADPVPTVHQLQQENPTRYMLSPQFGGGTCNVEFEVLTGYSMSFLPSGSVPYLQFIDRPVPSLAGYFESKGYRSLAIHSYEGWFWNREEVYKQMGFEGFKSKDAFVNPQYKGPYIADDEMARSIMQEVDETEEPVFIYAVTMENHAPYTDESRYGDNGSGNTIKVEGDLTDDAKRMLETYTQGAHDADESLRKLIEHYSQSDEPTYIVFYGDHLPTLGLEYDVYRQAGFVQSADPGDWSMEELKRLRSVPFVTWSNFPVKEDTVPTVSSSFVGAYALNALSMEPMGQFAFNSELYKSLPGLIRNLAVGPDGGLSHEAPPELAAKLEEYNLLQYDMLIGNRYLAKELDTGYLSGGALPVYNTLEPGAAEKQ